MTNKATQFKVGDPRPEGAGAKQGGIVRTSAETVKEWREMGREPPLYVMLSAMQEELDDKENIKNKRQYRRAFPYAVAAAPYFHAKPQAGFVGEVDPLQAAAAIVETVRAMEAATASTPPPKPPAPPKVAK